MVLALIVILQGPTFSVEEKIGPIRISTPVLAEIFRRVDRLIAADTGVEKGQLSLSDGRRSTSIMYPFAEAQLAEAPSLSYSADWRFYDPGLTPDVKMVFVDLDDYSRRIHVTGASREKVNAVARHLRDELSAHSVWLGGSGFRAIAGAILLTLCSLGPSLVASVSKSRETLTWISVFAVGGLISLFALPWEHWLPGTLVLAGDASWLNRNSGLLSLAGFILSLGVAIAPLFKRTKAARRRAK